MFRKKKKLEATPLQFNNYLDWEKELGFLSHIMTRKQNITLNFLINVYSSQLNEKEYLRDEDIDPIIDKDVKETLDEISDAYKDFLISKYFGSIENLTKYITEDFYVTLAGATINTNKSKIRMNSQKKAIELISKFNLDSSKPQKKK